MADRLHGSYIPSSNVLDIQNLENIKSIDSPEFKIFLSRLRNILNNISVSLNSKVSGNYPLTESVNGKKLFPDPSIAAMNKPPYRDIYPIAINFGSLPNNATKSVAHGLTIGATWSGVRIDGTATDQTGVSWIPIPHPDATNPVTVDVDATNVNITTTDDKTAYTICYIFLEYIKI